MRSIPHPVGSFGKSAGHRVALFLLFRWTFSDAPGASASIITRIRIATWVAHLYRFAKADEHATENQNMQNSGCAKSAASDANALIIMHQIAVQ